MYFKIDLNYIRLLKLLFVFYCILLSDNTLVKLIKHTLLTTNIYVYIYIYVRRIKTTFCPVAGSHQWMIVFIHEMKLGNRYGNPVSLALFVSPSLTRAPWTSFRLHVRVYRLLPECRRLSPIRRNASVFPCLDVES